MTEPRFIRIYDATYKGYVFIKSTVTNKVTIQIDNKNILTCDTFEDAKAAVDKWESNDVA